MKGLSKVAIETTEKLAIVLLESAVRKHGSNIPSNDPDFCEAFGVLRGAICTLGPRLSPSIRLAPGNGESTHVDIHAWCRELVIRSQKNILEEWKIAAAMRTESKGDKNAK